jgi:hypothetical protein
MHMNYKLWWRLMATRDGDATTSTHRNGGSSSSSVSSPHVSSCFLLFFLAQLTLFCSLQVLTCVRSTNGDDNERPCHHLNSCSKGGLCGYIATDASRRQCQACALGNDQWQCS